MAREFAGEEWDAMTRSQKVNWANLAMQYGVESPIPEGQPKVAIWEGKIEVDSGEVHTIH